MYIKAIYEREEIVPYFITCDLITNFFNYIFHFIKSICLYVGDSRPWVCRRPGEGACWLLL
jgi:hypothetical protein